MRKAFVERMAEFFKAHAGEWIDGKDLEVIGGRYAWRSRVSDCRTRFGMLIENRQRYKKSSDGTKFTITGGGNRGLSFTACGGRGRRRKS